MNLENISFNTLNERDNLIKQINEEYFEPLFENIIYIEEIVEEKIPYRFNLNEAQSILVTIFQYDIATPLGKQNVQTFLYKYGKYLQENLLDSFLDILCLEYMILRQYVPRRSKSAAKNQLALEIARLKIFDAAIPADQKIKDYRTLLSFVKELKEKFILGF